MIIVRIVLWKKHLADNFDEEMAEIAQAIKKMTRKLNGVEKCFCRFDL